jgi:hypothetical protein
MKKYILLLAFIPSILIAQNNADSLKFEIVKASISFLSTDKESFKESSGKSATCKFSEGYDCLKKYCEDNKLKGGGDKIDSWKKETTTSKESLAKFNEKIIAELTTGNEARAKRLKLAGFDGYKKTIVQLASSFSEVTPTSETMDLDETATESTIDETVPQVIEETKANDEGKSESKLPVIALILSILALAVSALNFFKGKGGASNKSSGNTDIHYLKGDISELKSKIAQKQSVDLTPLQNSIKNIENRIYNLENQSRIVELQVEKKPAQQTPSNTPVSNSQSVYAKLPDTGNGFGISSLTKEQNGEQIYEIEIKGDKATYNISSDANAQKYALTDFNYYLSSGCDLANQPVTGARIITIEKGILSKSGSNWIIQSKAKIEFK